MTVFPPGLGPAPNAVGFLSALPAETTAREPVVLDAGFGAGRLRPQIISSGIAWVGAELDAARVASARAAGYFAVRCDITESLPFRERSIDGVVLTFVLNLIPRRSRRKRLVEEVRRVLRPGGIVWICDFQRLRDARDMRIGRDVGRAEWEASCRRHDYGRELAAELTGVPLDDLMPGSFPAFRVQSSLPEAERFRAHRYSKGQFKWAVARRQVTVDFLACHSSSHELRDEWGSVGVVEYAQPTVGLARGGTRLLALNLLVRT